MKIIRFSFIVLFLFTMFITFPAGTALATDAEKKTTKIDQTIDEQLEKIVKEISRNMSRQQKWKIAVVEFSGINGQTGNLGKFISEELTTRLFSDGRFQVIERQLISSVLAEHKLSMTGLLDAKSTKKVGAILGVDVIVTGTIADIGPAFKINARTIAVDTGGVFSVASAVLPKNEQINQLVGITAAETMQTAKSDTLTTSPKPASRTNTAGPIVLKGRLFFDGQPLSNFTHAPANIYIYTHKIGKWVTPAYEYDPETSNFTIQVFSEDHYSVYAEVDANRANTKLYPGDYKGNGNISVYKTSASNLIIDMERLIHLTKPEDNGKPMDGYAGACFDKVRVTSPSLFAWDAIAQDVYYTYTVNRIECNPFAVKEMVAGDTTDATNIVLDLPVNREGDIYSITIVARKNGRNVGSLMTHGSNAYMWEYRFRVVK